MTVSVWGVPTNGVSALVTYAVTDGIVSPARYEQAPLVLKGFGYRLKGIGVATLPSKRADNAAQ